MIADAPPNDPAALTRKLMLPDGACRSLAALHGEVQTFLDGFMADIRL